MVSVRALSPLSNAPLFDPDRVGRLADQLRTALDTGDAEALRRGLTEAKRLSPEETKALLDRLGPEHTALLRQAISGPLRTDADGVPVAPRMPKPQATTPPKDAVLDGIRIDKQPLTAEQRRNAKVIIDEGRRRGLGDRDIQVALMTAIQESRLRNLPGGDRDSVGLFQQRPSQGWGTPKQLNDPRYAAGKFYDALVKVKGRDDLRLTVIAQKVQASAYPEAYAKWEKQARDLLRGL